MLVTNFYIALMTDRNTLEGLKKIQEFHKSRHGILEISSKCYNDPALIKLSNVVWRQEVPYIIDQDAACLLKTGKIHLDMYVGDFHMGTLGLYINNKLVAFCLVDRDKHCTDGDIENKFGNIYDFEAVIQFS
jgi:hypothetical protein